MDKPKLDRLNAVYTQLVSLREFHEYLQARNACKTLCFESPSSKKTIAIELPDLSDAILSSFKQVIAKELDRLELEFDKV